MSEEITAYIQLQTEVAKAIADHFGNESDLEDSALAADIIDMIHLESDLSRVSLQLLFFA